MARVDDRISPTVVAVSAPVKARLNAMKDEMTAAKGRQVSLSEVLEALLAEYDRCREQVTP